MADERRFAIECGMMFLDSDGKHRLIREGDPALFTREEAEKHASECSAKNRRGSGVYHGPVLVPEGPVLEQRVAFAMSGWGYPVRQICHADEAVLFPGSGPICTEPQGHEGDHVARDGSGRVVSSWAPRP